MLWCADSRAKVISIAWRARDAMDAFSTSLLERCAPLAMDPHWPDLLADSSTRPDPLDGLASVTDAYRDELGAQRSELLGGLLEHWGALLQSVRRHEQRSQTPGERLHWEDGRRLVLFTALVMVEIDRDCPGHLSPRQRLWLPTILSPSSLVNGTKLTILPP